jgi:hypothetical protein
VESCGANARALQRAAKPHNALATATPFVIATIGFCDAFLYCKGVLCYTLDDSKNIRSTPANKERASSRNGVRPNIPY